MCAFLVFHPRQFYSSHQRSCCGGNNKNQMNKKNGDILECVTALSGPPMSWRRRPFT